MTSRIKYPVLTAIPVIAILVIAILVLGAAFRFYDTNWDQNSHQHPDERFLTMVTNDSRLPDTFADYLDPKVSTLVPYNINFKYFTYGAFPVTLTKLCAVFFNLDNYDNIVLVGRRLAAAFDTFTILLIFFLAARLFNPSSALAASLVYALSVLPIQHSHFFVVDAFSVTFYLLALVLLICCKMPLFAGLAFGAALGCKISILLQIPMLFLALVFSSKNLAKITLNLALCTIGIYVGLRIADPKFFSSAEWFNPFINPQFIANLLELKRLSDFSEHPWPPGVQWLSKTPYIFTLQNFALYGFGIVATWLALLGSIKNFSSKRVAVLSLWCCIFMLYAGAQFLQTMRYLYPIYPLAALLAGLGFSAIISDYKKNKAVMVLVLSALLALWPLAFMQIYTGEHTRIEASRWILSHNPKLEKIAVEHWDDSLPLQIPGYDFSVKFLELPVFEPDSPQKIALLRTRSAQADAIILSSNRGWGSIMPLSAKFPLTIQWYQELFNGTGDFIERQRFSRLPKLFGYEFSEALADEAFSVYDHPEVRVFLRKSSLKP